PALHPPTKRHTSEPDTRCGWPYTRPRDRRAECHSAIANVQRVRRLLPQTADTLPRAMCRQTARVPPAPAEHGYAANWRYSWPSTPGRTPAEGVRPSGSGMAAAPDGNRLRVHRPPPSDCFLNNDWISYVGPFVPARTWVRSKVHCPPTTSRPASMPVNTAADPHLTDHVKAMSDPELEELAFRESPAPQIITQNRKILRCNHAFANLFGYTVEELTGELILKLYPCSADYYEIGERCLKALQDKN